jgi:hypothetical protein
MSHPVLPSLSESQAGRETVVAIRRLHAHGGELDGQVTALSARVDALRPGLSYDEILSQLQADGYESTADAQAAVATTAPTTPATPGTGDGDPPGPDPDPGDPPPSPGTGETALVASTKASLVTRGIALSGDCGAFEITKRVAWQLRSTDAGLLDKPTGANCSGYAPAIICYPNGHIIDILIDAGGTNGPNWARLASVDPTRYRAAIDPGD